MLYNSKQFEFLKEFSQLDLKNDFEELQPFRTFFHNDLTLSSAIAQIFAGAKKAFCHFKC